MQNNTLCDYSPILLPFFFFWWNSTGFHVDSGLHIRCYRSYLLHYHDHTTFMPFIPFYGLALPVPTHSPTDPVGLNSTGAYTYGPSH